MGWPSCLLQSLQWVFCRDSLSRGLNSKATLSGQLCFARKELYGTLWTDNSQQHKIQCFITLKCHWRCSKQWRNSVFGVSFRNMKTLDQINMYLSDPSVKVLLIDISCLSARPAPGEVAAIREKAKWECWHVAPKHYISTLSSLLKPLILLSSSLLAADDLSSDITEKREDTK